MRIAIFVRDFPPRYVAGTPIATYNLARYLAKKGHTVHVITSMDEGHQKHEYVEGFYVHWLPRPRFLSVIRSSLKNLYILMKIRPDVIHQQGIIGGRFTLLAAKILNIPYIVYGRGADVYADWRFKNIVARLILSRADAVIALTDEMKSVMQSYCQKDIYVIPNGVDLERFKQLPPKNFIRSQLGIGVRDDRIILFVGNLRQHKGVKYLIYAMEKVLKSCKEARLIIVGGDIGEKRNLEKIVKELELDPYVKFQGRVPNEEVPKFMAAADIFVMPSMFEGFSNAIIEAMASGLPIIATRAGGNASVIEDGVNGFLVETKNYEQLAEKILLLAESDVLRNEISENNKKKAEEYRWERIITRLEEVYCSLIAGSK